MEAKIRKTKAFHADSTWELEEKINKWFEFHLGIDIISTNYSSTDRNYSSGGFFGGGPCNFMEYDTLILFYPEENYDENEKKYV